MKKLQKSKWPNEHTSLETCKYYIKYAAGKQAKGHTQLFEDLVSIATLFVLEKFAKGLTVTREQIRESIRRGNVNTIFQVTESINHKKRGRPQQAYVDGWNPDLTQTKREPTMGEQESRSK